MCRYAIERSRQTVNLLPRGKHLGACLNVLGMLKNRKLSRAISEAGFYEFARQLEYKCKLYGIDFVKADRFFPSSKLCSNCGCKKDNLKLSERTYHCEHCGNIMDRDLNAAINLSYL